MSLLLFFIVFSSFLTFHACKVTYKIMLVFLWQAKSTIWQPNFSISFQPAPEQKSYFQALHLKKVFELDLLCSTHSCANPFCLAHAAKPAKRQAAAQPVPAAVAQPVVAPIAPNGNAIYMLSTLTCRLC